jgi:P27 family predicted phage terminase small subunit
MSNATAPQCPRELNATARAEWGRVVKLLTDQGTISRLDRAALTLYAEAWARWRHAEQQIVQTGGEIVKSPSGYPQQNPWRTAANGAARQMAQMAKELGLTPRSRKATKTQGRPEASRGLAILKATKNA